MVQGVVVPFHVKLLLPFAETVQAVIGMVCNLQVILPSTRRREMKVRKREVNKLKNWQLVDYIRTKRSNTNTGCVWGKMLWNNCFKFGETPQSLSPLLWYCICSHKEGVKFRCSTVLYYLAFGTNWLFLNYLLLHASILCAAVKGNTGNSSGQWPQEKREGWDSVYKINETERGVC